MYQHALKSRHRPRNLRCAVLGRIGNQPLDYLSVAMAYQQETVCLERCTLGAGFAQRAHGTGRPGQHVYTFNSNSDTS